jgi:electron transport complex protein RnfA
MNLSLMIFSGLSLNLILQFGLSLGGAAAVRRREEISWVPWGVLFLSPLILWGLFSRVPLFLYLGFGEYFLLFPLSVLVCMGLEKICLLAAPKTRDLPPLFTSISAYNGMVPAALMLTLRLAVSFAEAVVLALGFSLGALIAVLVPHEIRRRASMEAVPRFLRGRPIVVLSMGLLSLIFSSVAVLFLKALGVF